MSRDRINDARMWANRAYEEMDKATPADRGSPVIRAAINDLHECVHLLCDEIADLRAQSEPNDSVAEEIRRQWDIAPAAEG